MEASESGRIANVPEADSRQNKGNFVLDAVESLHVKLGEAHQHTCQSLDNTIVLYKTRDKPERPRSDEQNYHKRKLQKRDMSRKNNLNFLTYKISNYLDNV